MLNRVLIGALIVGHFSIQPVAIAGWRPLGPYGGDAEVVRISPSRPDTLLAGTRRGMIHLSNDAAASWTRVGSPAPTGCVLHALAIDPRIPERWLAGFDCDEIVGNAGLYETTDAGRSWKRPIPLRGKGVWAIAFSASGLKLAAGTTEGVFLDSGTGWNRISPESNKDLKPVVSLAFDPRDEEIIFAGTTHLPWRTTDGGKVWASIHAGMLDDSDVFSVSPDLTRKGLIFASACSGVYRSDTGGNLWRRLPTPRGAFRAYLVTPDPHREGVIYAATSLGLLRSSDGGATWVKLLGDIVHSVTFHPTVPRRVFIASSSSGILTTSDGGDTFKPANEGFSNRQYRSLTGAPGLLFTTALGERGTNLFRSVDEGKTWETDPAWPRNLNRVSISVRNAANVFGADSTRVHASTDSGKSWRLLPPAPGNRVLGLAASVHGIFAVTPTGLVEWKPGALTWTPVRLPLTEPIRGIHGNGTGFVSLFGDRAAAISKDYGATWSVCGVLDSAAGLNTLDGRPGLVLAGTAAGLFRSEDDCRTWSVVRSGINGDSVSLVSVHPSAPNVAFAAQQGHTFVSNDTGLSWKAINDEGRLGTYPLGFHVGASTPARLFGLFSGSGVMVQEFAAMETLINVAGEDSPGAVPASSNQQGDSRK